MNNKLFAFLLFQFLFIGVSFSQLIPLGVIDSLPRYNDDNLKRIYVNGVGEKFAFNDVFKNKITVFNMDGSLWKIIETPKNSNCTGIIGTYIPNDYRINANSGLEFCYWCSFANGLKNFGISDENGKTVAFIDTKAAEFLVTKTGMFTYRTSTSNTNPMQTINFYKNSNGSLNLNKTFITRYVGEVLNTVPTTSSYYFELGTQNNIIRFYDADFNNFKEVILPFEYPASTNSAIIWDYSQFSFNNDDNWEFVIWFFTPNGSGKYYLLNDKGKILGQRDFNNDLAYSLKSDRMFSTQTDSLTGQKYNFITELSSQRIIDTVPFSYTDWIGEFSGNVYLTKETDSTFEVFDEQFNSLKLIDKSKEVISGYKSNYTFLSELEDSTFVAFSYYEKQTNTSLKTIRIFFENGTKQDIVDLNDFYQEFGKRFKTGILPDNIVARFMAFYDNGINSQINNRVYYAYNKLSGLFESNSTLEGVKIYPNPTMDLINVELSKEIKGSTKIMLLNSLGQIIEKLDLEGNSTLIHLNTGLPEGTYFLYMENNGQKVMKKVIKF